MSFNDICHASGILEFGRKQMILQKRSETKEVKSHGRNVSNF